MNSLRFNPPEVDPSPELRWVLARAFGRPGLSVPLPGDPAAAIGIARRLDLATRVAARSTPAALRAEVGPVADDVVRALHVAVASGLRYEGTLRQVAGHAASRGIPLVVLKGCALALLGVGPAGARSFGDLDILVPVDRIAELRAALVADGWARSPLPASEHQEAPLNHPRLGMIELHRCIPGVRPPGSRRSFDARTLLDAGLIEPLPGFDGTVHAPSRPVLAAHALVHGLVQHGWAPGSYPLFRFLADLQDLGADDARLRDAGRYLQRDLDGDDIGAIAALLAAFESGAALELPAGAARSLLLHLLVGTLQPAYALGLKSDPRSLRTPSDLPLPLATLQWVYKAAVLSRAQVDAIYGPPKRPGGYLARQLLRPFDLGLRFVRSLRARR